MLRQHALPDIVERHLSGVRVIRTWMPSRTAPRRWDGVSVAVAKCSTWTTKGENIPVVGSKVQRWSRDWFDGHDSVPKQETGFSTIGRQAGLWLGPYALGLRRRYRAAVNYFFQLTAYAVPQAALRNKINKH